MVEITIGDVQFISNGKTLTIARRDQPEMAMSLDKKGIEELIDFVTSLAETEFSRRQTFRVPVWDSSGLSVQIRKDDTQLSVRPTNVSLTGIFVELRPVIGSISHRVPTSKSSWISRAKHTRIASSSDVAKPTDMVFFSLSQ